MSSNPQDAMHVLIVHYNTPDLTSRLIGDFPRQTPRGCPVFIHIFDNCSTPANLQTLRTNIKSLQFVTLQESDRNLGFGEGMNALADKSVINDSDTLWLLNSDTRLQGDCLETLERELIVGDFAIVAPLIYSGDESKSWIWYCGGSIKTPELLLLHDSYGQPLDDAPQLSFETEFVTGAAPMMHASTFRAVGGFPRDYFLYWEDAYFCWKARELGFRLGVVPSARLWHHVGASSGAGMSSVYYYWSSLNRFTFADDIGVSRSTLTLGRGGLESLRLIGRALFVERSDRLSKVSAAVRGTIQGLRSAHTPG